MFSSADIREKFLDFFEKKGHRIVPSSSLIPDDPSVLFTTAGMQQFKRYYTGELDAEKDFGSKNTVSIQKCFRTSDIDEVGDESHLTFFEMLGNFSFGGYFKEEAIEYAYEFIVKEMGLKIEYATIFDPAKVPEGDWRKSVPFDGESEKIWKKYGVEINREGIDVFWGPTGEEGPCGPTTEIYVKNAAGKAIEIWNIVFNEFYRDENKKLSPLKTPGIDTGMGLERLTMVVQNKPTIFETDLFEIPFSSTISGMGSSGRIMADHLRGIVFIIVDGVRPSNKGAGYILRRLIRRAIYQSKKMRNYSSLNNFMDNIIRFYGAYPDYKNLIVDAIIIHNVFREEAEKFEKGLDLGLREFGKKYPGLTAQFYNPGQALKIPETNKFISGEDAFYSHQTYGLTIDIIKDLAKNGLHQVDEEGFWREFKKHQEISRAGAEKKFGGHGLSPSAGETQGEGEDKEKIVRLHTATHLLQAALRQSLGDKVSQKGSNINAERLRFDFSFDRKLTPEELKKIEDLVNEKIKENLPVNFIELPKGEALASGALHFFGEKYPEKVKIYYTGSDLKSAFSKEFCGGPHVKNTSEIGKFKILKEEAVSSGVRRIKAAVLD